MQSRPTVTPKLLVFLACALHAPAVPAQAQRTFTQSDELMAAATRDAIEDTWKNGRPGEFQGQRGVKIVFLSFVQTDVSAERGAIVIVSGRTESMLKYKETIHDLWKSGYSVHIHDHRGQGLSDREPEVSLTPQKGYVSRFGDYVEDLRQFTREKVMPAGHKNLYLLAHSMGGAITALFLESGSNEAKQYRAAVLSSPMLKIKGIAGADAGIATCKIAKGYVKARKGTEYVVKGSDYKAKPFKDNEYTTSEIRYARLVEQVAAEPSIKLGSPTHGWLDQSCESAFRARIQSAAIEVPVHVMVAGEDSIVHNSGALAFCEQLDARRQPAACGGPKGGPLVIAGAKHEIFIESDQRRDQALNFALTFFEQHAR